MTAAQWERVFGALGFFPWPGAADGFFYNSDAKRELGPPAVYFDMANAISLPVAIVRQYLVRQGFDEVTLDSAIGSVGGEAPEI